MSQSNLVFKLALVSFLICSSLFPVPPERQKYDQSSLVGIIAKGKKRSKELLQASESPELLNFKYKSASVLPFMLLPEENGNMMYVILGREAGGKNAGLYDDFGGRRDPGEIDPARTAAREFAEEGLTKQSLGMGKGTMQRYIDPEGDNTELVLATKRAVMFITRFSAPEIVAFREKFFQALIEQTDVHKKEKDVIATVSFAQLLHAVKNADSNDGITVSAYLTDPEAGKENDFRRSTITLRPLLVRKLRPLALGQSFRVGKNPKIRFY